MIIYIYEFCILVLDVKIKMSFSISCLADYKENCINNNKKLGM